ncbi:hypothetical protein PENCOP_c001G00955 [Penicillium coprophilum]|uniref:BTB domain-containing protein n=1 Tax=Penicillium coprophilum TaxID=36646 RepID=A0A1V6V7Q7_9EURO|nr:hypothetical protein PENCOP_c001G00955 [Penicillium coprophilum]
MNSHLVKADLSGGIVKIDVGETNTPFDVHMELLCNCSPYFDNLFQRRFDQPLTEQVISFPDDDPQIFAQVILWMYRGNDSLDLVADEKLGFLVRLWILAGNFEMIDLQNQVMLVCKKRVDESLGILGVDTINYIYSHTLPQSPMRLLAVDVWVQRSTTKGFGTRQEEVPRPFLEDLCHGFIKEREKSDLPPTLLKLSDHRYLIDFLPLEDRGGKVLRPTGAVEIKQTATEAEMETRKIKIPCSRTKAKSVMENTGVGVDGQRDMFGKSD